MPNKLLIVGKNSTIVKEISDEFSDADIISHLDISNVNFDVYDRIFIFSWSKKSLDENLKLLSTFNLSKVTFISTISVLACAKRKQWASYPKNKLFCENIVLQSGGQVIRIGIWGNSLINNFNGVVPITTPKLLTIAMRNSLLGSEKIHWPLNFKLGKLNGIKLFINNLTSVISIALPNSFIFQIPIAFLCKLIRLKDYGYTHDCLYFFSDRVLVGFGAVGSQISKELSNIGISHTIVVSKSKNILLNSNGFKGTRIGEYKEGLSKLWHGVWIREENSDKPTKFVPLFVKRPSIPRNAILGKVFEINFEGSIFSIKIENSNIADVRVFSNNIHLAAGVINNIKILQSNHKINTTFSDHEITEIGSIETNELISRGLVNHHFGFIFGKNIIKSKYYDNNYMIDFRPKVKNLIKFDSENIYNNRTQQIIYKIIKSLSFQLINQALFNKFGIAIKVPALSVIIQIEAPNCIELKEDGSLKRFRLDKSIFSGIAKDLSSTFNTFTSAIDIQTFDAIHVHGGIDITRYPLLHSFLKNKRLFLHGNVFDGTPLGPFHNTNSMINREIDAIRNI